MAGDYQISCSKFCGFIRVDEDGLIIDAMPIVRKFIGQPVKNLSDWCTKRFGGVTLQKLGGQSDD